MGRLKLLITNIFYFGGLKILSSLFPLLLYPYISKLISPADFGLYDIFMVIVGLSTSISMLGIQDAMFKEYYEKNDSTYKRLVISTGFVLVVLASLAFSLLLVLFKSFYQSSFLDNPSNYFVIYYAAIFVTLTNVSNTFVHPSRLNNNKKELIYYTFLFAILFYLSAIGLLYYNRSFLSLIYANFITILVIAIVFGKIHFRLFYPLRFSKKIAKSLLTIGLPLVPIFIIYWANNSIIRILIIKHLGATELGVFAIGSKYASISTFIQAAFAGGWSYFTFSTMKDKDQVEMKSKVFESLLFIIVIAYAFLSPFVPYLFKMLFEGDYIRGYTVFGQLFLGPLLLILYQIIANQFTIIEKSYFSLIALSVGFLIGLFFCYFFIYKGYGIKGASYSIPISYTFAIFLSYYFGKRYNLFHFSKYTYLSFFFLIVMNLVILLTHGTNSFIFCFSLLIIYLIINRLPIIELFQIAKPYLKIKRNG
jgi:O-antigen/teichoic acid export membrane protein